MKIVIVRMTGGIGGAEIYNQNLVEGLKKYYPKTEIFFLTNLPAIASRIKKVGAEVSTIPVFHEEVGTKRGLMRLFLALPKYLYFFSRKIFYLRFKKGVKLALFQGTTEKIILTPLLRLLKFRIIWLEHGPLFSFNRAFLILALYRLNSHFVSQIITVSQDARQDLTKGGITETKVIFLPTGVDTEYFRPLPAKQRQELIVGYLGAICPEKGITEFIEVGKKVCQQLSQVKFMLVGKNRLMKKKKDFLFTGFKRDVRPYLGYFSIFFFPTHLEGLSLAVLEAMAMGIPVVARDIGGNRELIVHGKTGYLFKNESNEEIAEMIIKLLKDQKKREKMGKLARERIVRYFNLERWTKEMRTAFESCLENEKKS